MKRTLRTKSLVASASRALAAALKQSLGSDRVITEKSSLPAWGGDKWFVSQTPDLVVLPRNAAEIAESLRLASQYGVPITARGAGYGYVGGCVPVQGGMVLTTERMKRLRISARDFIAIAEPGIITGDLQRRVEAKGLFYPPDPASLDHCSIGGNIATNAAGPRCLKYGVTRNYVLGLQVALVDGTLVRVGGQTHKNKAGFDLVGLFVGSEGLLGIVTEATLKLLPLPPAQGVLSASFLSIKAAAAAVHSIFAAGFLPSAIEIADAFTLQAARQVNKGTPVGNAHLLVEVDGQRNTVRVEVQAIAHLLSQHGADSLSTALTPSECEALWNIRRGFSFALRDTGLTKLNEDIVVPRGKLVDLIHLAARLQKASGFPIACFGHAGDGNIHVNIMAADYSNPSVSRRVKDVLDELFEQVIDWGGTITGEHGIGLAKCRWWPKAIPAATRALHQTIKHALDPQDLLNPGKFIN